MLRLRRQTFVGAGYVHGIERLVEEEFGASRNGPCATDLDPKASQPGMTREELAAALKDHVKGSAGLVTRFKPP